MNAARTAPGSLALLSLSAVALVAHCTRPAPQVVEMPPPPESYSLTATTVRRTDTAAPTESAAPAATEATAGDASAPPATDASAEASAPAAVAAQPDATPAETGPRLAARAALDAQHAALARCYDEILVTAPEALGRVSVELSVTSAAVISRADVRVEGEGGLAQARSCIEAAMRAVRFTDIPTQGATIRRSYSFVNPSIEIAVAQPIRVQAPARNARPAEAQQAAAAAPARGVLTEPEVAAQIAVATAPLQACYATALRRAARLAGSGEARFTIQPNGQVQSATWGATAQPIALMGECIGPALQALRFRNSGTGATVRATIEFAR